MLSLIRGQKIKLSDLIDATPFQVGISIYTNKSLVLDISCFGVDSNNKLSDDRYFIFYNQKKSPCNSLLSLGSKNGDQELFEINLYNLPASICKLVFVVTIDGEGVMSDIKDGYLRLLNQSNELCRFSFSNSDFKNEKAIIIGEIYFKDFWRFSAVGLGFNDGLSALLKYFGGKEIIVSEVNKTTEQTIDKKQVQNLPIVNIEKSIGKVNLNKHSQPVLIKKTPEIIVTISWKTGTDYDIYALVYTSDNKQIDVATFGAENTPVLTNFDNGSVQHMGDVGRDGNSIKNEIIKIRLNEKILAIVPVAYSAQSNGTGSFQRYKVSMLIDNKEGTLVTISADNANNNDTVYTCAIGMILNTQNGIIIKPLELYSHSGSENRPKLVRNKNSQIEVIMDAGPINNYK